MSLSRRFRKRLPKCEGTGSWSYDGPVAGPTGPCGRIANQFFVVDKRYGFERRNSPRPMMSLLSQCDKCAGGLPAPTLAKRIRWRDRKDWKTFALVFSTMES
jgi:hypothetical protein